METTNSLATKLLIVPKFTSYFIYSRVYNIGVFYSRLLHSISIHACYCFGTASSRPMLCRPKSEFFAYSQNIDTLESFTVIFSPKKLALLSLLKKIKPSPNRKMIKLLTYDNLFPQVGHFGRHIFGRDFWATFSRSPPGN